MRLVAIVARMEELKNKFKIFIFFPLFRNQQSDYLGALWADVLAVFRGEVPSSEEISVVDSVNYWLIYGSS